MSKRNEELQTRLKKLTEHKQYLKSLERSYTTVLNTKNKQLKSAAVQQLQKQLVLLAELSKECLDYIQKHSTDLSQSNIRETMQTIGGLIEEFDQYLNQNIVNQKTFKFYLDLFDHLSNTHELISQNNQPIILEYEGKDKLLLKNLHGQIEFIKKLNNNPDNFKPENIKKTKKRVESINLILEQIEYKLIEGPNRKTFQKLLNQAQSDLKALNLKVFLNETEETSVSNEAPVSTKSMNKTVYQEANNQNQLLLRKLKRLNSAVILRYYFKRDDNAAKSLDKSILEMKTELLNLLNPRLYNTLNTYLDEKIKNIHSYEQKDLISIDKQTMMFLIETVKTTQNVLESLKRFGHNEIENKLIEQVGNLHNKILEFRQTVAKKIVKDQKHPLIGLKRLRKLKSAAKLKIP